MARRVSEPTYTKYIVGEIPRFDESRQAYSRALRGEFSPDGAGPKEAPAGPAHHQVFRFNADREKRPGFSRTDFALRWAGRTLDFVGRKNLIGRESEPTAPRVEITDPYRITKIVKNAARWFGADLVGITALDRSWVYSHRGDNSVRAGIPGKIGEPLELPDCMTNVIVLAMELDYDTIRRTPAVETASDRGYSNICLVVPMVARFIQELGYRALPAGNDTALSIPLAVDAGLGEMGRNGLLITDRFGPRVQIGKVFTDLPLLHDQPVDLGVQAFCEVCRRCSDACPSGALTRGERTADAINISVNSGLLKWPVSPDRCFPFWVANGIHCSTCIRVCPFNKPDTRFHRAVRWLVERQPRLHRLCNWADARLGYGRQVLDDLEYELY